MPAFRALLLALVTALAFCGSAWAQEPKGWLGIEVRDLTKAEADQLGWDHGALVAADPAKGSPAEKAGLKAGDLIIGIARSFIDTAADFNAALEHKNAGSELRLQVVSGRRGRRVTVALAIQPGTHTADTAPDPAARHRRAHGARSRASPSRPTAGSWSPPATTRSIRVWDWQAGKTCASSAARSARATRARSTPWPCRPMGAGWRSAAGCTGCAGRWATSACYDFPRVELVALLKGHAGVVSGLAFSPDGKRLISGSGRRSTAIIWDVENRKLLQHAERPHRHRSMRSASRRMARAPYRQLRQTAQALVGRRRPGDRHAHRTQGQGAGAGRLARRTAPSPPAARMARCGSGTAAPAATSAASRTRAALVGTLSFTPGRQAAALGTCEAPADATQRVWDVATGKEVVDLHKHDNVVVAAAISPDGRLVGHGRRQQSRDPHLGPQDRRDQAGARRHRHARAGRSASRQTDGSIAWGTYLRMREPPTRAARWSGSFGCRTPSSPRSARDAGSARLQPVFLRAFASSGAYALAHRQGGDYGYRRHPRHPEGRQDGGLDRARSHRSGYQHRSYTFTPDGQTIISGGANGFIHAYDLKGKKLGDFIGHEGDVWAVTPSRRRPATWSRAAAIRPSACGTSRRAS